MITSEDLGFFNVLAGSSSLAEAARKLNVTPPAVTQRLQSLEARAGVRLVERTGRRFSLTEAGTLVALHGRTVAQTLEALTESLADRALKVAGHLRVCAPHGFGRLHVAPVVRDFVHRYEGVTVSLDLSDSPGAQLIETCDVIIHIGPPGPANQVMTTLAPNRRILCASPAYLQRLGPLKTPNDLVGQRCLVVTENDEDVTLWRFSREGSSPETVRIHPTMASNDGAVVRDWLLAGMGIAIRSEWNVADDLAKGRLIEVLPDWHLPSADVVAMLGARFGRSARTTAFLSMLRHSLQPAPWREQL